MIVVPSASLPATPYKHAAGTRRATHSRCSPTAPAANPGARNWCRGEFAPGHDAKRKARLWTQAREGVEALEELRRRGWKRPPEMR